MQKRTSGRGRISMAAAAFSGKKVARSITPVSRCGGALRHSRVIVLELAAFLVADGAALAQSGATRTAHIDFAQVESLKAASSGALIYETNVGVKRERFSRELPLRTNDIYFLTLTRLNGR